MLASAETQTASRSSLQDTIRAVAPTAVPAVAVLAVAYDDGGYGLSFRLALAVAAWWAIALAAAFGFGEFRLSRAAVAVGGVLGAFALWTLLSAAWASNAETAVEEFARNALYAGVFLLALVVGGRTTSWVAGIAAGTAGVGFLALASRLFPSFGSHDPLGATIEGTRLSWPVGYWNGLGVLLAMSVPLVLGTAVRTRSAVVAGGAVAAVPPVLAALYLTSSRGAAAGLVVGLV